MKYMWDDRASFPIRSFALTPTRSSYMRWAQAWMLLAMSTFLCESDMTVIHREPTIQQLSFRHAEPSHVRSHYPSAERGPVH